MRLVVLNDFSERELKRMRRKLDTISGPGVRNSRDKITIAQTPPGSKPGPVPARQTLPVPQYQYMVLQAVGQNVLGADWTRGHPLL